MIYIQRFLSLLPFVLILYTYTVFHFTLNDLNSSFLNYICFYKEEGNVISIETKTDIDFLVNVSIPGVYNILKADLVEKDVCMLILSEDSVNTKVDYFKEEENHNVYGECYARTHIGRDFLYLNGSFNDLSMRTDGNAMFKLNCSITCTEIKKARECSVPKIIVKANFLIYFINFNLILAALIILKITRVKRIEDLLYIFLKNLNLAEKFDIFDFCNIKTNEPYLFGGENKAFKFSKNDPYLDEHKSCRLNGKKTEVLIQRKKVYARQIEQSLCMGNQKVYDLKVSDLAFENLLSVIYCYDNFAMPIINDEENHCLDIETIIEEFNKGKVLKIVESVTPKKCYGYQNYYDAIENSKLSLKGLTIKRLIKHNILFFSESLGNLRAFTRAVKNRKNWLNIKTDAKNSQWKLYISDVGYILKNDGVDYPITDKRKPTEACKIAMVTEPDLPEFKKLTFKRIEKTNNDNNNESDVIVEDNKNKESKILIKFGDLASVEVQINEKFVNNEEKSNLPDKSAESLPLKERIITAINEVDEELLSYDLDIDKRLEPYRELKDEARRVIKMDEIGVSRLKAERNRLDRDLNKLSKPSVVEMNKDRISVINTQLNEVLENLKIINEYKMTPNEIKEKLAEMSRLNKEEIREKMTILLPIIKEQRKKIYALFEKIIEMFGKPAECQKKTNDIEKIKELNLNYNELMKIFVKNDKISERVRKNLKLNKYLNRSSPFILMVLAYLKALENNDKGKNFIAGKYDKIKITLKPSIDGEDEIIKDVEMKNLTENIPLRLIKKVKGKLIKSLKINDKKEDKKMPQNNSSNIIRSFNIKLEYSDLKKLDCFDVDNFISLIINDVKNEFNSSVNGKLMRTWDYFKNKMYEFINENELLIESI